MSGMWSCAVAPRSPSWMGLRCPRILASAAATMGYDTLALADVNGVPGAPRFFAAARQAGVRPLVGAEVTLVDSDAAPVLLLVENRTGYRNLCRLLTRVHADRPKGTGSATHALLAEHAGGLIALAGAAARSICPCCSGRSDATTFTWKYNVTSTRRKRTGRGRCWPKRRRHGFPWWRPTTSATPRRTDGACTTSSPARRRASRSTRRDAGCRPTPSTI